MTDYLLKDMAEALRRAKVELAALIPRPDDPEEVDWPVENAADAACLQKAYVAVLNAIEMYEAYGEPTA